MPDDQAKEKRQLLEQFGAHVELVKPASIVNAKHYVNEAKRRARAIDGTACSIHSVCIRSPPLGWVHTLVKADDDVTDTGWLS